MQLSSGVTAEEKATRGEGFEPTEESRNRIKRNEV